MTHPRLISLALAATLVVPLAARAAEGEAPMSLEQCLKATLEGNQDIAVAHEDELGAAALHDAAHGIFDTLLNASLNSSKSESLARSTLTGAEVFVAKNSNADVGASQLLPWGGTVSFDINASRDENNSAFQSFNPSYQAGFTLGFRHPLLRNRGKDVTRHQILLTKISERASHKRYALEVIRDLQLVENAYWDLVMARSDLEVKRQSLKVAQDLLAQNKIRVDVGTLAPIELVQAEAGVAQRNVEIITAQQVLKDTDERLKRLMGTVPDAPLWDQTIVPTDLPTTPEIGVTLEQARAAAQGKRMEIRLAEDDLRGKEITSAYQKNQTLPQLDATASYNSAGTGGDLIVRDPVTGQVLQVVPGGLSDAFRQARGIDFPTWTVGLSLAYPVRNRTAKGAYASARIDEERSRIVLVKAKQDADVDVRAAYRALATARESIEASRVAERAEEKKLEAEKKKFENGLSTSYQVLTFDAELSLARSQRELAEVNARKAAVNLQRAMGTLLEDKGVVIEGDDKASHE